MANSERFDAKRIEEALQFQKEKDAGWTLYNEREFMENLLQTRFNFLLTAYALFVNAFVQIKYSNFPLKLSVLIIGLVVIFIMGLTIYRIYKKLDIVLKILHQLDGDHVFPYVKEAIKDWRKFRHSGVNHLIGWVIPLMLAVTFILGIIAVCRHAL